MPATIESDIFCSPPAIKIGEFDAAAVQADIDTGNYVALIEVNSRVKYLAGMKSFTGSLEYFGVEHAELWEEPCFDTYLESPRTALNAPLQNEDKWHVDVDIYNNASTTVWKYIPLILATTQHPTETLSGAATVPRLHNAGETNVVNVVSDFFDSDEGQAALEVAIETGDMEPSNFQLGNILFLPKGTLHRRPQKLHNAGRALFKATPRQY